MFCPSCRDEFRAGFTHCESCDVDLVDDLDAPTPQRPAPAVHAAGDAALPTRVPMADFCGYFSLDDARHARDLLRGETIRSEIVIRSAPDSPPDGPVTEEYWLRIEVARLPQAEVLLDRLEAGGDPADATSPCPACGAAVPEQESFCASCGARIEGPS